MQERGEEDSDVEVDEEFMEGSDVHYLRRQVNTHTAQEMCKSTLICLRMHTYIPTYLPPSLPRSLPTYL